MSKRSFITNITPLPDNVTRKQALALLHNHREMIELNPLVLRHETTQAPPNATPEEQVNCQWYEITDIINYLPGGAVKSEVSYKGGFYDLPYGLQTHVFAPAGVDLKAIWRVGGNMKGEPPAPAEMGIQTPKEGLYLREDIEMKCNVFLTNFVKRNLKKSHGVLVERLLSKVKSLPNERPQSTRLNSLPSGRPQSMRLQSSPTDTVSSSRLVSSPSQHASAYSPLSHPVSQQSTQTFRTITPQQQEEPCSCESGGHDVMCPNYRYGAPVSRKQTPAPAPKPGRSYHFQPAPPQWPPQADRRPADADGIYTPAVVHPDADCDCRKDDHLFTCQYYTPPGQRAPHYPPHTQTSSQVSKPMIRPAPKHQAQAGSYGRMVWKLPPGSKDTGVAYRSPQLFGEQAELPGTTVSSERDEDWTDLTLEQYPNMAKQNAAEAIAELDGTELAYWEAEGRDENAAGPRWL